MAFKTTGTLSLAGLLPVGIAHDEAIGALQNHESFTRLTRLNVGCKKVSASDVDPWLVEQTAARMTLWGCKTLGVLPGTDPDYREVVERVPVFFGMTSTDVTTHSAYMDTEDGVLVLFSAPLGLQGWNRWIVREVDNALTPDEVVDYEVGTETQKPQVEKRLELVEEVSITGWKVMIPTVMTTKEAVHWEIVAALIKSFEPNPAIDNLNLVEEQVLNINSTHVP